MDRHDLRRPGPGPWLAALCAAVAVPLAVHARDLGFRQVFDTRGEPRTLHYSAVFTSGGAGHRVEIWREGDRRLRRRTDDALEIYAFRDAGDPEFRMSILDLKRRIHTRIDRTNLYRIGGSTDWFDLAHGLRPPAGTYRLVRARPPEGAPAAVDACEWYDLVQGKQTAHVCWSARARLPLIIQGPGSGMSWRVTALDRRPIPVSIFTIHDDGFVRTDANEDIERD